MSYFNMVCDSCGREVHGCNIVNGMKLCAKCYQETFGETDKDKQIAELQKQLAEKDKELSEYVKIVDDLHKQLSDKCDFCDKTKDQDKILFAIEQLEKVKGLIANHTQELWTCENDDIDLVLYEEIDNQIKELKGEE